MIPLFTACVTTLISQGSGVAADLIPIKPECINCLKTEIKLIKQVGFRLAGMKTCSHAGPLWVRFVFQNICFICPSARNVSVNLNGAHAPLFMSFSIQTLLVCGCSSHTADRCILLFLESFYNLHGNH